MAVNGKRIRQLRKETELTQEALGKKLGVIKQTVSSWENDISEPNSEVLSNMASIFNVSIDYLLGNDTQNSHGQKINPINKGSNSLKERYFFFFFNEENLLRDIFANRIKSAIADIGLSEDDFINQIPIGVEKATSFLECKGEPTADDLIELSQFLNTSIDYLLGQIPKLNKEEKKLLNSFVKLDTDRKDIIIGKTKELLLQQQTSCVAAGESLKKTGTENMGK